jgi:hypothetical protein
MPTDSVAGAHIDIADHNTNLESLREYAGEYYLPLIPVVL